MLKGIRLDGRSSMSKQAADFEGHIQGIPCGILVGRIDITAGTYSCHASCPDDFYGHAEIEFSVLDSRGYPAPWLDKKMTDKDVARIEKQILEFSREEA